jgi:hypothetical protein
MSYLISKGEDPLEYTVVDADHVVLVLFIGNHDDAAAYLRGKK